MFFSVRDCSRCRGLMWLDTQPMITAERPASSGMMSDAPPLSMGTRPRNSVPGAPESVMEWMTSTRPKRMTTWMARGMSERSAW